ncbi:MAG TPA: carotenoid oxygenase family protein [Steroidobacteraceae bacterium]|nr:carotenoid oxygenase family protein [Steroidobacteraceae bacterium]
MSRTFPDTPEFTGLNAPIGAEYELRGLKVEGRIPADVRGTFFRAIPDPAFPPYIEDGAAVISGDGMVSAMRFAGGEVSFAIRYVQTERHRAEVAAGRALFGKYRNPFTDDARAAGLDRTVANTTPVWHAGRLLMTKEDGRPYRLDPRTLATLGRYDFGGRLRSATVTAHVRVDPASGELFFFGYEADGLASTKVAYCIADRHGDLDREQWFDAPYCAMMHDFCITERYALFPIYPTTCDLTRLKAGGDHWVHELGRESWVGVMPRYGSVAELRWFRGPNGVSCYHMMNAFEDAGGGIHLDQCLANVNAFPFIQRASGLNVAPGDTGACLARWTINLEDGSDRVTETTIGPPGDLPMIPAAFQGRPYTHGWLLTMNPGMQGPPVAGGPVGVMFNTLLRVDLTGKPPQALALPPAHCLSEPVHVPSSQPSHEGWLLTVVDQQTAAADFSHALWILDAGNVAAGPLAQVRIPHRLRPQVHGWWVSATELDAA